MAFNAQHFYKIQDTFDPKYRGWWVVIQKERLCGLGPTRYEAYREAREQSYYRPDKDRFVHPIGTDYHLNV
jgi:hypothetical protein